MCRQKLSRKELEKYWKEKHYARERILRDENADRRFKEVSYFLKYQERMKTGGIRE